jgi:hypothetical protein
MAKFCVNGSTRTTCREMEASFRNTFDDITITLGVQEAVTILDDILSDYDQLKPEDFDKLLDLAGAIQSIAVLRDAEKLCMNCDNPRSCVNCENFAKIHGNF